ncbi:MAG: hypothetical protein IJX92_02555 [Clostridia bacterium]|nr:hypothetical protein [Clostridia bacterium]
MKNVMIFGDSYSTFKGYIPDGYAIYYDGVNGTDLKDVSQTWWDIFVKGYGLNLVLNNSWSGSTVCYTGRQNPEYARRSSFVNRMEELARDDFYNKNEIDTFFIFGGTNDSWLDATLPGEMKFEGIDDSDLYFTLPAICYLIARLKEERPNARIISIINTELDPKIAECFKAASLHYETEFVELCDIDKMSGHPTVKGMAQIADQVSNYVKTH